MNVLNPTRMAGRCYCTPNNVLKEFSKNGKKIIGAAVNYLDVVKSKGIPMPDFPVVFLKPSSSYICEGQPIIIPKNFERVAHEVELGVIIGKTCKNISKDSAMSYVGGYCLALDLTAQCEIEKARSKSLPWTLAKGFDTSTPVSKFIPATEVHDPHNLRLWCKVNEEIRQDSCTSNLIFKIPDLIEYISSYMTLEPNDLILTGTPNGALPFDSEDEIECGLDDFIRMKFKALKYKET